MEVVGEEVSGGLGVVSMAVGMSETGVEGEV